MTRKSSQPTDTARSRIDQMSFGELRARALALEAIDEVGRVLAAELDVAKLVQAITEAGFKLTGAESGTFLMSGASALAHSSVPHDVHVPFGFPGAGTGLLGGTCEITRVDDVAADARFAHLAAPVPPVTPFSSARAEAVRSFLVVPVAGRTGGVLGGFVYGHPTPGWFTSEHEHLLAGIARYAAIALDNARLYQKARSDEIVNARLAAIVQSSDDAIVGKDLNGVVQSWNAGAERMFGYTASEMVGRPITVLFPADRPDEEAGLLTQLRQGHRIDHFETVRVTKAGRLISVSVSISPIRDADGRIVGASKVARDISERKQAESEREQLLSAERAARAEAERHSRMKDEFLATLGHELRTPLNAVLGWAHILQHQGSDAAEVAQGLTVIERNARLQAQLIEDLLDMSRIISGKLRIAVQPVEMSTVIHAAIESARPAADAKGISLNSVLDPLAGSVSGDPNRLQQVIWNLLSNAVKFTPKGGRVHVVLERVDSHVSISVSDTGEGIVPEFLPRVFDRFRQGDASTTRQHGGLGLGLAIVKHLVELHGGTVHARSPGPGKGSTFMVWVPVRATGVSEGEAPAGLAGHEATGAEVSLEGIRAVVVDDEADARDLVKRVLEHAGAEVEPAESVQDALIAVERRVPDVVVSDIGMPGEDGYSLIRRLRALPKSRGGDVPAIALTAFARADDRRRALLSGFQMHVPKPVEAAELLAVVASVTGRV